CEANPTFTWTNNGKTVDKTDKAWELVIGRYYNHDYTVDQYFPSSTTSAPVNHSLTNVAGPDGKLYAHLWYLSGGIPRCAGDKNDRYNCAFFTYFAPDALE